MPSDPSRHAAWRGLANNHWAKVCAEFERDTDKSYDYSTTRKVLTIEPDFMNCEAYPEPIELERAP